jgi:hypothetical protein
MNLTDLDAQLARERHAELVAEALALRALRLARAERRTEQPQRRISLMWRLLAALRPGRPAHHAG